MTGSCKYLLCSRDVLDKGLFLQNVSLTKGASQKTREWYFKRLYGSSPRTLANQWYLLQTTKNTDARLSDKEATDKGFRRFMIAHSFLWSYCGSIDVAVRFKQCERYSRGEHIWDWIGKIAALQDEVIVWDEWLDSEDSEIFIVTVDGTDFKVREQSTKQFNVDKRKYSKKFNHGAVKYEIAISLATGRAVWISGPHRGGKNDQTIFDEGLRHKIKQGKLVIADGGYSGPMVSAPDPNEPKPVRRFKARARSRHETFNGRLKYFSILGDMFRHEPTQKHALALYAVAVTVNMQIDAGSELFVL